MGQTDLTLRRVRLPGGDLRVEGRLSNSDGHWYVLFFEVPRAQAGWVTKLADPLVVGLLMPMMKWGYPVRVHGRVTSRLLDQVAEAQRLFVRWMPEEFREVAIQPDALARPRRPPRLARPLLAFSGGTDSSYSAWKWTEPTPQGKRLAWAVMAHGFDTPLKETDYFREHAALCADTLKSRGVSLFTVRCNGMETAGAFGLRWGLTQHGPAVAALLLLFQKKFDLGLLASTYPCDNLHLPWGSNSLTDPLWSSGEMNILHDGASMYRLDKLQKMMGWPQGLAHMRTCWKWPRPSGNCGVCYKCIHIRTILVALGQPDLIAFPGTLTPDMVRTIKFETRQDVVNWQKLLRTAEANLPGSPWLEVIRDAVARGLQEFPPASAPRHE